MNHPKPLYDTLSSINEPTKFCVLDYIQSFSIPDALTEYEVSKEFLLNYAGSSDTFTAYRREIERLLQWCWCVKKKPLKAVDRNDLRDYIEFSNNPPSAWIGIKTVARFIDEEGERKHNPVWRPYVARIKKAQYEQGKMPDKSHYQLSNKSLQALLASLSTYFTYLQQEGYIEVNPVHLIRQKKRYVQREHTQKVTRKLSKIQWKTVIETAENLADRNVDYERSLFILSAFYLLGLRISELAETTSKIPCMSDFAPDKNGLWWFTTIGKGNKLRDVAVPDEMLEALKRYRKSCDLSALPARGEQIPLLAKRRGRGGLGSRQIRNLVQQCFNQAIYHLKKAGKTDEAEDLTAATVHWLRHTAISTDVEERPREHVRDDAGHDSSVTTDRYIDIDRTARHKSAKYKKLKPE